MSYVHVCARVRSLQLLCSLVWRVCCTSDAGFLRTALQVPVRGCEHHNVQSFAAIAEHYALDQCPLLAKWSFIPLSEGMLSWLIHTRRVLFELLQELSHASLCLLVSYTPLARFCGRIIAERRRERPSYRLETVLVLDINASANSRRRDPVALIKSISKLRL